MPSSTSVRGRRNLGNVLGRDVAVVDGDGKALVLHTHSGDRLEVVAQFRSCALQGGYRGGCRIVLVVSAVGSDELEAVAAGVPDPR